MQDYVNLLLDAINNYNEEDIDTKKKLRDLVCVISENNNLKKIRLLENYCIPLHIRCVFLAIMCKMDFIEMMFR